MRIAIIGWGSLIWDPRCLPHCGTWYLGGPRLPIEFSRISPDGRLTLIIDREHGHPVVSRWSRSPRSGIQHAVADLAAREVCDPDGIGFLDRGHPEQPDVPTTVRRWCASNDLDGAVWTALPGTFEQRAGRPFSVANAMDYLDSLVGSDRARALAYLRNAPEQVDTPVRRAFEADPRFGGD